MKQIRRLFALITLAPMLALGQSGIYRFPGQIQSVDGTVGSPQYSWTSDPDTGLYRIGADQIGFATGGVLRAQADATGFTVPAGQLFSASGGGTLTGTFAGAVTWSGVQTWTTPSASTVPVINTEAAQAGFLRFSRAGTSKGYIGLASGASDVITIQSTDDIILTTDSAADSIQLNPNGTNVADFSNTAATINVPLTASLGASPADSFITTINGTNSGHMLRSTGAYGNSLGSVHAAAGFVLASNAYSSSVSSDSWRGTTADPNVGSVAIRLFAVSTGNAFELRAKTTASTTAAAFATYFDTPIITATYAGAVTLGPSTGTPNITHTLQSGTTNIATFAYNAATIKVPTYINANGLKFKGTAASTFYEANVGVLQTATSETSIVAVGPDTSTRGSFSVYNSSSNGSSVIQSLNITAAGAVTLGPTTGAPDLTHTLQSGTTNIATFAYNAATINVPTTINASTFTLTSAAATIISAEIVGTGSANASRVFVDNSGLNIDAYSLYRSNTTLWAAGINASDSNKYKIVAGASTSAAAGVIELSSNAATINVPLTVSSAIWLSGATTATVASAYPSPIGGKESSLLLPVGSTQSVALARNIYYDGAFRHTYQNRPGAFLSVASGTVATDIALELYSTTSTSHAAGDAVGAGLTSKFSITHAGAVTLGPDTSTNAPLITRVNTTANAKYTTFKGGGSNFNLAPSSNIAIPTGVSGSGGNSLVIINYGNVSAAGSALILCGHGNKAQIINTTGTAITETSTPGANQIGVLYDTASGALTIYGGSLASGNHLIRITILGNGA
jgi:hypothetical protein